MGVRFGLPPRRAGRTSVGMTLFQLAALFLTLVAGAGWINARFLHLPSGVAMLLAGAAIPAMQPLSSRFGLDLTTLARQVDFPGTVMGSMLAFLLFAGATQVDLAEMRRRRASIWSLATLGVLVSTLLVGGGLWLVAKALNLDLPLPWALAFGALISPTDPIAVLATLKDDGLSGTLRTVLQGEALFNDGVGIVVFTALATLLAGGPEPLDHGGTGRGSGGGRPRSRCCRRLADDPDDAGGGRLRGGGDPDLGPRGRRLRPGPGPPPFGPDRRSLRRPSDRRP